jgi:hypothetical protein
VSAPLTYEALRQAFELIRNEPRRVHGTASDPHLTSVGGTTCIICGRRVDPAAIGETP